MNKKQRRVIIGLWTFFLNILIAIGLLRLVSDLRPDWIQWNGISEYFPDVFRALRNIVLFPLTFFISLFRVSIPEWVRTYLFLGVLFLLSYNRAYRKKRGDYSDSSLVHFIRSGFHPEPAKNILFWIFLWPVKVVGLIRYINVPKSENHHLVYKEWGKHLLISLIFAVLFVVLGYSLYYS